MSPCLPKDIQEACEELGQDWWQAQVDRDARNYVRARDLPKWLPCKDLQDFSPEATQEIIERLERLNTNICYTKWMGHWAYDQSKHIAVLGALKAEQATLLHALNTKHLADVLWTMAECASHTEQAS